MMRCTIKERTWLNMPLIYVTSLTFYSEISPLNDIAQKIILILLVILLIWARPFYIKVCFLLRFLSGNCSSNLKIKANKFDVFKFHMHRYSFRKIIWNFIKRRGPKSFIEKVGEFLYSHFSFLTLCEVSNNDLVRKELICAY
jgi:hypothetical protein